MEYELCKAQACSFSKHKEFCLNQPPVFAVSHPYGAIPPISYPEIL